jgi:hypothetical protein
VDLRDLISGKERFDIRGVAREFAALAGFGAFCHRYTGSVVGSMNDLSVGFETTFVILTDSAEALCVAKGRISPIMFATCLQGVRKKRKYLRALLPAGGLTSYFRHFLPQERQQARIVFRSQPPKD